MGWTKRSAAVSVLLVLDEHRKQAGVRVVQLREARRWTQEDLAHKAGVSVKTVSRFENGKHEGRRDTVKAIAKAFGTTEAEIIGEPPAPLGLGAREEQVSEGFEEFREYVRELHAHIASVEQKLAKAEKRLKRDLDRNFNLTERVLTLVDGLTAAEVAQAIEQAAGVESPDAPSKRAESDDTRSATQD